MLGEIVDKTHVRQLFVSVRDARTWRAALAGRAIDHVWGVHAGPLPASFHEAIGSIPATLLLDDGRVDPKLGAAPPAPAGDLSPDRPALVLFTSGSTGKPLRRRPDVSQRRREYWVDRRLPWA